MYRVLLVDDCIEDSEGLKQYVPWEKHECEVIGIATNGQDGYEKALELKPDIIISDVSMPVKDGLEMAKMINEMLCEVAYIFISCFDSFEYVDTAFETGAYAYILKPIKLEKIEEALEKVKRSFVGKKKNDDMIRYLSEQFEKSKSILFERYLSDLLLGIDDDFEKFKLFDMENVSLCKIVVFKLMRTFDYDKEVHLNRMYLKELCYNNIGNAHYIFVEQDKIAMLIFDNLDSDYVDIVQKICDEMKQVLEQEVCGYIYDKTIEISNLSDFFKKFSNIINNNFFENADGAVLVNEIFYNNDINSNFLDIGLIQEDINHLFSNQFDLKSFLDKYYPLTPTSSVYLKSVSYALLSIINVFLFEKNCTLSQIFENESLLWKKLSKFDSVFNIRQWFFNIISEIINYLNSNLTETKQTKIASNICKYIDENYASEYALSEASDEQGISLNHANTIFKEHYNKTIFEYLVECRIKNAKKLLTTTKLKVHEIAKQVGYPNEKYFPAVFKKHTGRTPQQFRDEH